VSLPKNNTLNNSHIFETPRKELKESIIGLDSTDAKISKSVQLASEKVDKIAD
jgi:hypothetical protein